MAYGSAPRVQSENELLDIALAMEANAARHYRELEAWAEERGFAELAAVFRKLVATKEAHGAAVQDRGRLRGRIGDPADTSRMVPPVFEDVVTRSDQLTPYSVLSRAVHNEQRAFAFFAYVAAGARKREVKLLAEQLARDKLEHASALRRERRLAFRSKPPPDSPLPRDAASLAAISAAWESEAARASDPVSGYTLERNFDRYMQTAERSKDEAVVAEAQRLAQATLRQLALMAAERKHGPTPAERPPR